MNTFDLRRATREGQGRGRATGFCDARIASGLMSSSCSLKNDSLAIMSSGAGAGDATNRDWDGICDWSNMDWPAERGARVSQCTGMCDAAANQ